MGSGNGERFLDSTEVRNKSLSVTVTNANATSRPAKVCSTVVVLQDF